MSSPAPRLLAQTPSSTVPVNLPPVDPVFARQQFDTKTLAGRRGYFRVGRSITGHWWFQDPQGNPFFYRGVTSVSRGDDLEHPRPYTKAVLDIYGLDPSGFRNATFERLHQWGFNALGAWSSKELWDQGMPFTIILNFLTAGPQIEGMDLPDVFDPAWRRGIDATAKKIVEPERKSRALVGYFTDNELSWGQQIPGGLNLASNALDPKRAPTLLQLCLSESPDKAAYQAAWKFLLARHGGSLHQIAMAWKVPLDDRSIVQGWTKAQAALQSVEYVKDDSAFTAEFARRYFKLTAQAIHRYDRHHLILGCRFGGAPPDSVLAQIRRPWVDVVSANNYRYEMKQRMSIYARTTGMPVLNTEFSWGHGGFSKRPLPNEGPSGATDVERMVGNGEAALEEAFRMPELVGYTWYRWSDKVAFVPPVTYGLVTIHDDPNTITTDLVTRVNQCAERISVTGSCALKVVASEGTGVDHAR